ncbi:MAG: hypothetical protein U0Q16_23390 [Bryobacteraceae bacterium]
MHSRLILILFLALSATFAQPVLTPSPDRTGTEAGVDVGPYNIVNSVETGYRFTTVGGEKSLFRSSENYGNGLRLFGADFAIKAKNGEGRYFDSFTLRTSGLGNDPYGYAGATLEKKDLYRYDMTWRRNDYYNPSLLNGGGANFRATQRTLQDHEFFYTPRKWIKFTAGYARNQEGGPEFTAYESYIGGLARSVLPLARTVRRDFNEYRPGVEIDFLGFRFSVSHRWEYYKDDSPIASLIPGQPYAAGFLLARPFDPSLEATYPLAATSYMRSQAMHTQRRGWLGHLTRSEKFWAMSAHMTYSKGESSTVYVESQSGASQAAATNIPTGDGRLLTGTNSGFGVPINAVTYMPGRARQPFLAGDFSFSVFPTEKLTITTNTSVHSNRYDGTGNEFRQLSNGAAIINRFWTFHIGTGRVSSALDLNYKVNRWLGLHSEYRYTSRFIDNNLVRTGTTNNRDLNSVRNHLNMATFGFRLKPAKPLSVQFDGTIGRDNGPLTPVSPAHFHNVRARIDYRMKRTRLGVSYRQNYNLNAPLSVVSPSTGQLIAGAQLDYYASHSRDISANASFEVNRRLGLDANYSKAHWDSFANLWAELVPPGSTTINTVSTRGYVSRYVSNLHTVSLLARTTVRRATLYAGYALTRDAGDGRGVQNLGLTNLAAAYTAAWSTFPMSYQAPLARLSFHISPKVQWNLGWQFYFYNQKFAYFGYQPFYRAHTGYTSLSYTFGEVPKPREARSNVKETKQ